MFTSNFLQYGKHENAVAISAGVPAWFKGRRYDSLAPERWMLSLAEPEFRETYEKKILGRLDPRVVQAELGPSPILLCWEGFNILCHRRIVAEWIEREVGIVVSEFGVAREICLSYVDLPLKTPKRKTVKETMDEHPKLF